MPNSRIGPRFYNLYGQGENPVTITGLSRACHADRSHPRQLERLQSCGRAHPEWGEEVVAFVVFDPARAATESARDALCLASNAR